MVKEKTFSSKDSYPSSSQEHVKGEKLIVAYDPSDASENYIVSTKNKRNKYIIATLFFMASGGCFF